MVDGSSGHRREFFRQLLPRAARLVSDLTEELRGRPQMLLSELAHYPDAVLRNVVPAFGEQLTWTCHAGRMRIHGDAGELLDEWSISGEDEQALALFSNGQTLEVTAAVIETRAADGVTRYPAVKAFFLGLCGRGLCHPLQSLANCELDEAP